MTKTFNQNYAEFNIPMEGRKAAIDAIEFPGDIYIFGVWSGVSTKLVSDYLQEQHIPYDRILGFDSFIGLPEEDPALRHREHTIGKYSSTGLYRKTIAETMNLIEEGVDDKKLTLFPGFYEKTLDAELIYTENLGVASFVDIDVDLHGSTVEVLEFLFSGGLVAHGTTIYFDDWGATQEYKGGESLAWKQQTEKYNIKYKEIHSSGEPPCTVKVFKIL